MFGIAVRTHFLQDKNALREKKNWHNLFASSRSPDRLTSHSSVFLSLSFFLLSALSSCSAATGLTTLVLYTLMLYWSSGTYIGTGKHDRDGAWTAIPLAMVCVSAREAILQSDWLLPVTTCVRLGLQTMNSSPVNVIVEQLSCNTVWLYTWRFLFRTFNSILSCLVHTVCAYMWYPQFELILSNAYLK